MVSAEGLTNHAIQAFVRCAADSGGARGVGHRAPAAPL